MSPSNDTPLTGLPQELFDIIISHLKDHEDISSLSRTSKALRFATIKLVFENVTMLWTGDDRVDKCEPSVLQQVEYLRSQNPNVIETSPGCECPRLDLLLRSILETPKHGEYVRKINLQCFRFRFRSKNFELPAPPNAGEYHSLIKATMRRIGLDQMILGEEMEDDLKRNRLNAVAALLILLCPNITSLTLGFDLIKFNTILQVILHDYTLPSEISCSISRLQYLEEVIIGTGLETRESLELRVAKYLTSRWATYPDSFFDFDSYLPIFYLPRLKRAELSLPAARAEDFEWPAESSSYSRLQTLLLLASTITPHVLHNILEYTPNVTRLEYDHWAWRDDNFKCQDMAAALECLSNTLMHLKISIRIWWNTDLADLADIGLEVYTSVEQYCSLKNLLALQTVTIPACILLGFHFLGRKEPMKLADVLAANIRTICLTDDLSDLRHYPMRDATLFPIIQEFAISETWRKVTPQLKAFQLCYGRWQQQDELRELCSQNGWAHSITKPERSNIYGRW